VTNLRWANGLRFGRIRAVDTPNVRTSTKSDPTGNTATGLPQERIRNAVRKAQREIERAMKAFENAEAILTHALETADQHVPLREEFRPTISRGELAQARAAKTRREERGEGWGDG
jgi:hypothetical protein